jgi:hypothetical protein
MNSHLIMRIFGIDFRIIIALLLYSSVINNFVFAVYVEVIWAHGHNAVMVAHYILFMFTSRARMLTVLTCVHLLIFTDSL